MSGDLKTFRSQLNVPWVYWLVHVSGCPLVWNPSCPVKGSWGMDTKQDWGGGDGEVLGSAGPSEGKRQGQGRVSAVSSAHHS